jgi:predicted DNA-binding protein
MAQDLELIVEMLREMKRANGTNSEGFDRLLYNIEHKLDSLDKNVATSEFIKTYLSELAKLVEEKYSTTLSMFSDIENAVKNIYQEQDKHSKNSELKESFETFSNNMNDFYLESRHQKSLLTSIESKCSKISK